jgi:transposase
LEADLWHTHCDVSALPVDRVRLDATTSCGYHTVTDEGLMQLGHSKDHRPDLAQFKLMAAVAEPSGLYLAGDIHPGNAQGGIVSKPVIAPSMKLTLRRRAHQG